MRARTVLRLMMSWRAWAPVLPGVALALIMLTWLGAPSYAVSSSTVAAPTVGIPGIDLCDPQPPLVDSPDEGLPGTFLERPQTITPSYDQPAVDPEHLFATGGLGGMDPHPYDLGCGMNPGNWEKVVTAGGDASVGEQFVAAGQAATAFADSVDRRAWSPSWIMTFLGNFSDSVMDVLTGRILLPFLAIGLLATSAYGAWKSKKGNVAAALGSTTWVLVVLFVGAAVLSGPTRIANGFQSAGSDIVSALHNGDDPATGATESITTAVHYQSWLRRAFGSSESSTAKEYGPQLLAASRMSWEEAERTDPGKATNDDDRERRLDARKELIEHKQDAFKAVAEKIKNEDPKAYEHLQNVRPSMGVAFIEMSFAFVASIFRIAVAILLVLAMILLVVYGIVFVCALPVIVTPWGEDLGKGLFSGTFVAAAYVFVAALGSWLFGIWTEVSLQPGHQIWWSAFLLAIGTFIFWTAIRPDRKALNLLTMGRVRSNGRFTRRMIRRALVGAGVAYGASRGAATGQARAIRDELREDEEERDRRYAYGTSTPAGEPAPRYDGPDGNIPYTHPPEESYSRNPNQQFEFRKYDPLDRDGSERARAAGNSPLPEPPPRGASGDDDVYRPEETVITEPAKDPGDAAWWRR